MELAYLSEVREDALVLREVDGDTDAYGGVGPGFSLPAEMSWCHQMVAGSAPQLVTDAAELPQATTHPFVQATGIRAYAGVPVRREDGSLLGTLCCLSREPQPQLGERDLRYLDVLARMAAQRLEAVATAQERKRAEVEAAAGQALLAALNARENYTAEHSEAVLELALEVASELGLPTEEADLRRPGRAAARHRQGRRARRDPAQAGLAHRPGVGGHARAPGDRRADRQRHRLALPPRPGRARGARALGRRRLPRRPRRRGRAARQPHLLRLRRLARDDLRPPVPARALPGPGARGAAPQRRHAVLPGHRRRPRARARPRRPGGRGARAARHARGAARASAPTGRSRRSCAR